MWVPMLSPTRLAAAFAASEYPEMKNSAMRIESEKTTQRITRFLVWVASRRRGKATFVYPFTMATARMCVPVAPRQRSGKTLAVNPWAAGMASRLHKFSMCQYSRVWKRR